MIITISFAALLLAAAVLLLALFINALRLLAKHIRKAESGPAMRRLKKNMIFLLLALLLCAGLVGASQITAHTPAASGANAIAELRQITLNGRKEWISIRGSDTGNPLLLFLAGGPGGSQMAAVRHELAALEEHFVVVNWDQPGSGKSYAAIDTAAITVDTYIEDGHALAGYLCQTFGQEKIYLMGESWGSALAIFLAHKAPERYHAVIGTGQMVAFLATEITDYELALQLAGDKGDAQTVETLLANGPPPYYGDDVTWKSAAYLNYLSAHMAQNPAIQNGGYHTFRDLFSPEYGLLDKVNYLRGIVNTFNSVYPQLYDIDLRVDYPALSVPVYFFLGRHDVNAPTALVEDYYALLTAPKKEIVWFEHSGHSPWMNESELFISQVLRVTGVA